MSRTDRKVSGSTGQQFRKGSVIELDNICYMGSNVISGAAKGIVLKRGIKTYLGTIAKSLVGHRATTAFDKGISKVELFIDSFYAGYGSVRVFREWFYER